MIKMIADHGFRQVIQSFVEIGYELRMSNFLTKGQKQWCLLNSSLIVFLIDLFHTNFFSILSMLEKIDSKLGPFLRTGADLKPLFVLVYFLYINSSNYI